MKTKNIIEAIFAQFDLSPAINETPEGCDFEALIYGIFRRVRVRGGIVTVAGAGRIEGRLGPALTSVARQSHLEHSRW